MTFRKSRTLRGAAFLLAQPPMPDGMFIPSETFRDARTDSIIRGIADSLQTFGTGWITHPAQRYAQRASLERQCDNLRHFLPFSLKHFGLRDEFSESHRNRKATDPDLSKNNLLLNNNYLNKFNSSTRGSQDGLR